MNVTDSAAIVLVVDDDPHDRFNLSVVIASLGYAVETAVDGEDALAKIDAKPVAAILTDLMMPRMDGFHFLRALMDRGELTPAIVLTGFDDTLKPTGAPFDMGCRRLEPQTSVAHFVQGAAGASGTAPSPVSGPLPRAPPTRPYS